MQDIEDFAKGGDDALIGYKDYKNTWGEVEARNVEARLKKEIGTTKKDIENYKDGLEIQERLNSDEISDYTKATLRQNARKTLKQMPQLKQKVEYSTSGFNDPHPYATIDILLKDGKVKAESNKTAKSSKKAVEATPSATADRIIQQLKQDINVESLNKEQKEVYEVFIGKREVAYIKGKDESDLYTLEKGSRKAGARKIIIKHAGLEKTGGLSSKELLEMDKFIKDGEILKDSFELRENAIRYAYGLEKDGVKFRLAIDEYNDGKKIFDYYSDRNFVDYSDSTILQTNAHLGSGILSGSVAGVEEDENGNISINPTAFLAGLIGGSVASKGIAKGWKVLQENPKKIKIPQLPKQQNYKEFKENILKASSKTQGNNAFINTPQGLVKVHIPYAFFHFQKSGNKKENREAFNGSLISILQEPNYILKDSEKLYFYKVFLNEKREVELISGILDSKGRLDYKTTYEANKNKLKFLIKSKKAEIIYQS